MKEKNQSLTWYAKEAMKTVRKHYQSKRYQYKSSNVTNAISMLNRSLYSNVMHCVMLKWKFLKDPSWPIDAQRNLQPLKLMVSAKIPKKCYQNIIQIAKFENFSHLCNEFSTYTVFLRIVSASTFPSLFQKFQFHFFWTVRKIRSPQG